MIARSKEISMKSPKASVKTQIPSAWLEQFEQLAKQTGRSTGELVREALEQYLIANKELFLDESSDLTLKGFSQELETLKTELAQLTQQVKQLSSHSQLIATTSTRLTILETLVNNNGNSSVAAIANFSQATNLEKSQEEDDSDCDEPDEILTDFLPRDRW